MALKFKIRHFAPYLFSALTLVVVYKTYTYSENILFHYENWTSAKTQLGKALWGARAFLVTKVALAGNHLDLSAWHGFQELDYNKDVAPEAVQFDVLLESTCVTFIFNKDAHGFVGIKLCSENGNAGFYFRADSSGKYLSVHPFHLNIPNGKWTTVNLMMNDSCFVNVSGNKISFPCERIGKKRIGFKGEYKRCLIDNIVITDSEGIIRENFSYHGKLQWTFMGIELLILAFIHVLLRLSFNVRKQTYALFLIFTGSVTYSSLYYFYWSSRYPTNYDKVNWHDLASEIETEDQVVSRLQKEYPYQKKPGEKSILFIGSSQTWGAGASTPENTFTNIVQKEIREKTGNPNVVCINTAISGAYSKQLLDLYQQRWIAYEPEIVVINLAINDNDAKIFEESISGLVRLNQSKGIKTILIKEPSESGFDSFHENLSVLDKIAAQFNVPVIDMHDYLQQKKTEGFLWWDSAHLTDFGQWLFAERLTQEIIEKNELL